MGTTKEAGAVAEPHTNESMETLSKPHAVILVQARSLTNEEKRRLDVGDAVFFRRRDR